MLVTDLSLNIYLIFYLYSRVSVTSNQIASYIYYIGVNQSERVLHFVRTRMEHINLNILIASFKILITKICFAIDGAKLQIYESFDIVEVPT